MAVEVMAIAKGIILLAIRVIVISAKAMKIAVAHDDSYGSHDYLGRSHGD